MGMPVQWKPKGNKTLKPLNLLKPAANSAFVNENAWPRWRRPFMYGYLRAYICEMCRVDDVSRRQTGRRQTAFSECEPRASAHAGSRAGSFRVLAGPGTTAGRSLSSRASSLASLAFCVCGRGSLRESNKKLGLALLRVGLERAFVLPLLLDLGF